MKIGKKLLLLLVFILICVCMVACNDKTSQGAGTGDGEQSIEALDAVTGITINQHLIVWNAVSQAEYYGIVINGEEHLTNEAFFDVRTINLPKGAYSVQVKAYTSNKNKKTSTSDAVMITYAGAETVYTVQIVSQDGGTTNFTSREYKANNVVDLIAYPKEGYHFDGWYSDNFYKLSSEKTFSFSINGNTVIFANFSLDAETINKEAYEDSELMRCSEDFAVVVLCPEGESYIKEHFFVYDDYFLDDDGNVVGGCEEYAERKIGRIESRGNDLYIISPREEYAKSGAYVAKATGNVSILKEYSRFMNSVGSQNASAKNADDAGADIDSELSALEDDKGVDSLTFSIDNVPHEDIKLRADVYIYSYGSNEEATSDNVDGWILERIGDGIYDPDTGISGGFTTRSITVRNGYDLKEGDVVGFGGTMTKNITVSQINENSVFGRIKDIIYCGDTEYYPIIYVELESVESDSDVFETLDVYSEGDIDIENYVDVDDEELKTGAANLFFASEDFQKFLASVEVATERYAEENDCVLQDGALNAASILDKIKLKPELKKEKNKFSLTIRGNLDIEFGKKEKKYGKAGGVFSVSFEFTEALKFEYSFSWVKKKTKVFKIKYTAGIDLKVVTTNETKFVFDVAVKYSAGTQTAKFILNESTKYVHVADCFHVDQMNESNKKTSNETIQEIEKKGYTPCKHCIHPKYIVNNSSKCIHLTNCFHVAQMLPTNKRPTTLSIEDLTKDGYWACGSCHPDKADEEIDPEDTEAFRKKISDSLGYEDWGEKLNELKKCLKDSDANYDSSKDFKLVEVPFNFVVTVWLKAYLTLSFNVEASVHYEQKTSTRVTIGVRAAIGENFRTAYEKEELGTTKEMTIVGKIGIKAGVKLEIAVSDPLNLVSLGLYGTVGVYADLAGIVHISNVGENYAGAYFELGFYYDFGLTYKVLMFKGSVSISKLFGLSGKVPFVKMGYDKVIYAYTRDVSEVLVQASENKNEFTLGELNLLGVKTISLPSMKTAQETLDLSSGDYVVNLRLKDGTYYEIVGSSIRVKSGAPETFEDTLSISITSKDKSWKTFKGHNDILYLPTITVKLVCANKCTDHALIYLPTEDPTCEDTGLEECFMCTYCLKLFDIEMNVQLTERKVIAALGHDIVPIPAVPATCYKTGLGEGAICQRCEYISVAQPVTDALGHEAGEEWHIAVEASCEGQGSMYRSCIRCDLPMNYKAVLPLGHDAGDQELSCQNPILCTRCDKVLAKAIGHDYYETSKKDPTCETNGWKVLTCRKCSGNTTEIINATGHADRKDADEVWVSVASTCLDAGEWSWRCNHVGCDVEGGKICKERIAPDGHIYADDYTVDLEPTCTEPGEKSIHCVKCGVKKSDSRVTLDALGHDSTPATCTTDEVCARCDKKIKSALGHKYELATPGNEEAIYRCLTCGDEVTHTHDFELKVIQPTCTSQGYTEHTCKEEFCSHYTYRSDFNQREHAWQESKRGEATCSNNGFVEYVCAYSDCGETKTETLVAHHVYDEDYTVDVEPTCTAKGSKSKHCLWYDICGVKTDAQDIDEKGHTANMEHASCVEDSVCVTCGQVLEKSIGHDFREVEGTREYESYTALFRCEKCGEEKTEAFAHNYGSGEVIAPTCVSEGYTIYRCTDKNCNFEKKDNYTAKVDHVYGDTGVITEPTCIADGFATYACLVCGHEDRRAYEDNQKLGHFWKESPAVNPTCTEPGKTAGVYCLRCKKVSVEQETIDKLGHNYKDTKVEPTCTQDGYTRHACDRCGDSYDDSKTAAHGLIKVERKEAACETAGNIEYYRCSLLTCGKLYSDKGGLNQISAANTVIAAKGHDYDRSSYFKYENSTCAKTGKAAYKCKNCDDLEEHIIDKKDHTNKINARIEPTCTTEGKTEGVECAVCGEIIVPQNTIPAKGHSYETTRKEATCTEAGLITYTCTVCNGKGEDGREEGWQYYEDIDPLGHDMTCIAKKKDAGCFTDGNEEYWQCNTCKKYYSDEIADEKMEEGEWIIPAYNEHNFMQSESHTASKNCEENYTVYKCTRCTNADGSFVTKIVYDEHDLDADCVCNICTLTVHKAGANCICTRCGGKAHTFNSDCLCTVCGKTVHGLKEGKYCRHDNNVYFGTYPQTEVKDYSLMDTLNSMAGALPTKEDVQSWKCYDYHYYEPIALMWTGTVDMFYIDIEYDGENYRGVFFTQYRPKDSRAFAYPENSILSDNRYFSSAIYWFKYEPIKWSILNEISGRALILADIALDSQQYYGKGNTRTIDGKKIYANNYAESEIRKWLNDNFYNTAFNSLQKKVIEETNVINGVSSTGFDSNDYVCENTKDNIFLLSYEEASEYFTNDLSRRKKSTDYAKSQGCWKNTDTSMEGIFKDNCYWGLRSPDSSNDIHVRYVGSDGCVYSNRHVRYTDCGVVPALWIKLT